MALLEETYNALYVGQQPIVRAETCVLSLSSLFRRAKACTCDCVVAVCVPLL